MCLVYSPLHYSTSDYILDTLFSPRSEQSLPLLGLTDLSYLNYEQGSQRLYNLPEIEEYTRQYPIDETLSHDCMELWLQDRVSSFCPFYFTGR